MFPAALLVAVFFPPDLPRGIPDVWLDDARRFGVSAEETHWTWARGDRHQNAMYPVVATNNSPDVLEAWKYEVLWRHRAWSLLDDVLYPGWGFDDERRLHSLRLLRQHIGIDDYYAGRMPAPTPTYKMPR